MSVRDRRATVPSAPTRADNAAAGMRRPAAVPGMASWLALVGGWATCIALVGCGQGPATGPAAFDPSSPVSIMDRMVRAYQDADAYRDQGRLTVAFESDAGPKEFVTEFSAALVRPNRLRLRVYQATVVVDGKHLRATLDDLPGQMLERPAPTALTIPVLFEDPILAQVLSGGIAGNNLVTFLLLSDNPLQLMLAEAGNAELLASADVGGHVCYRVQYQHAQGPMVFWIDQESFVLRRFEYPTRELLNFLAAGGATGLRSARMAIDFAGAEFAAPADEATFQMAVPADTKAVAAFDLSGATPGGAPPRAELAAESAPTKLKLVPAWKSTDLARPGNLRVIVGPDGAARLLVHDGYRAVAEFDAGGKLLGRHELDLPPAVGGVEPVVSYLRTAVDGAGQRFYLACGPSQQQCHLFDAQWKRLLSYPEGEHAGLSDVQLADIDGDGQLEIVLAYFGVVGVHCVDLQGKRRWSYRTQIENLFASALVGPDDKRRFRIVCSDGSGRLFPFAADGAPETPVALSGGIARVLASADLAADAAARQAAWRDLAAIAAAGPGQDRVVGLAGDLREAWSYPLPPGLPAEAGLEMLTSGQLVPGDKGGQWLVAGADGSLHVLSASGQVLDRWNTGRALAGVAACQLGGHPHLVLSSPAGVEAFRIEAPGK